MDLKRPNKKLEQTIQATVKKMLCPIHHKAAQIQMPNEEAEVQVEACCPFFKKDVFIVGERIRKEFLYKDQKTRERLERERIKGKYGKKEED
jgi:hypothetical protein